MKEPEETDPKPNVPETTDVSPPAARERVLQHLRRTMKTLAVTGVGLATLSSVGQSNSQTDRATVPTPSTGPERPPAVCDPLPPPRIPLPKRRPPVCDPMPPPIHCDVAWDAKYLNRFMIYSAFPVKEKASDGIKMTFSLRQGKRASEVAIQHGDPVIENGRNANLVRTRTFLEVTVVPKRGAQEVAMTFALSCQGQKAKLRFVVDLSTPVAVGGRLPSRVDVEVESRK